MVVSNLSIEEALGPEHDVNSFCHVMSYIFSSYHDSNAKILPRLHGTHAALQVPLPHSQPDEVARDQEHLRSAESQRAEKLVDDG